MFVWASLSAQAGLPFAWACVCIAAFASPVPVAVQAKETALKDLKLTAKNKSRELTNADFIEALVLGFPTDVAKSVKVHMASLFCDFAFHSSRCLSQQLQCGYAPALLQALRLGVIPIFPCDVLEKMAALPVGFAKIHAEPGVEELLRDIAKAADSTCRPYVKDCMKALGFKTNCVVM